MHHNNKSTDIKTYTDIKGTRLDQFRNITYSNDLAS
jgi:hypothetical protein